MFQFCEGTTELGHTRTALGIWTVHSEDGVLVGVEGSRAAMRCEIPVQRFEVGVRALARHEAELHQLAGRIVDEHEQRARLATLLEPAVVAAVDLDQFTEALAPKARLVEGFFVVYATATSLRPSSIAAASSLPIRS